LGHIVFVLLHLVALAFSVGLLIITIPLHLIYAGVSKKPPAPPAEPTGATHMRCYACAELVLKQAKVCKHCGSPFGQPKT
jgi:hypothetical protein